MTVRCRIHWYRLHWYPHYYPVAGKGQIEHHEKTYDSRPHRVLAFRRATDQQSRKPVPGMRSLPLGSLVSKVNINERGTGDKIEAECLDE